MKQYTAEERAALIADCEEEIVELDKRLTTWGEVWIPYLQSKIKRQQIALAALTAKPVDREEVEALMYWEKPFYTTPPVAALVLPGEVTDSHAEIFAIGEECTIAEAFRAGANRMLEKVRRLNSTVPAEVMELVKKIEHWSEMARLTSSQESILSADQLDAIAEAFRALEQRAEAAEAKAVNLNDGWLNAVSERDEARARLAELEKQEPAGKQYRVSAKGNNSATGWSLWHDGGGEQYRNSYDVEVRDVFARPAPSVSLAELVPGEMSFAAAMGAVDDPVEVSAEVRGWNACRAAILRNIEDAK